MKNKLKSFFSKVVGLPKKFGRSRGIVSPKNSHISFDSFEKVIEKPRYKSAKNPNLLNILNNKEFIIKNLIKRFKTEFGYTPRVGIELEFYLISNMDNNKSEKDVLQNILKECKKRKIKILALENERGEGQFEIKTYPETNLVKLAKNIVEIKRIIREEAANGGFEADFSAQPYPDDCGNALQINLSFWDKNKRNVFERKQDKKMREPVETRELLVCVGGVCKVIQESTILFAQDEADYKRFDVHTNRALHASGKFTAPSNISWGGDNRTVAVRIPAQKFTTLKNFKKSDKDRRIENRVPSADCDPYLAIIGTLRGAYNGLVGGIEPPKKIYENAYDVEGLEGIRFGRELGLDLF
jgi:glutamine synthetase